MDPQARQVPLFWRIFLLNAAVLSAATGLLLFTPASVSTAATPAEAARLFAALAVMLVANAALLRVGLAPLSRLTRTMATVDLLRPGRRLAVTGNSGIASLVRTFNTMLERLEAERATSAGRALTAQEDERRRIAQELHDEVGQSLTAVLLELKRVGDHAPDEVRAELREVQETTRNSLDEIRRIARRLRPGVLHELGLTSALRSLATEYSTRGVSVRARIEPDLPDLAEDAELVVYRIAQEGLTNTARHARAEQVDLTLRRTPGGVELLVRDDGRGLRGAPEGAGIRGMRERALLAGADLTVGASPAGGTEVRLRLPARTPEMGVATDAEPASLRQG
ncbi:two-component system sensor histidine kinase UhpB [Asanoa ferruginea]|uniref:histidine kinase n=1 Tax=Asanoa ferruginea TaxID=53367 RepID=A0A3D9ZNT4_9ACTN|nr:two-component system sensor histidine kinase UhpB [Asanoa ferruginea]GIF46403.1 histidine kinase [Asanoa ferruginea]